MLHILPLVQIEQDAKDEDLYELLRESEREERGVYAKSINADSIFSNFAH